MGGSPMFRGWRRFFAAWLGCVLAAGAFAAPRTVTFSGKVMDALGQPAGAARVSVGLSDMPGSAGAGGRAALAQTTAAADGSFRLDVPVSGERPSATVIALKDGNGPGGQVVGPEAAATGLALYLTRPGFVAGKVVDRSGQAVAGAGVWALWGT